MKKEFIETIQPKLKLKGYRKHGNYWYKEHNGYLLCIAVMGSQWNADDYYVEFGFSNMYFQNKNPTYLHWLCSHRITGDSGELNIGEDDLFKYLMETEKDLPDSNQVFQFLSNKKAVKVGCQYHF